MNKKQILVLGLLTFLSGCASNIKSLPYENYSTAEITVFSSNELGETNYSVINEVKGIDCSPTWFRISNVENAMNKLIEESIKVGANGLINVTCWDSGLGPVAWCNNSASCKGQAIKLE